MQPPLIVILGAGASVDSGNYRWVEGINPPLTIDLFDEADYDRHLRADPLAQQAGRHINRLRAADDALALEQVLRDLGASPYPHRSLMALDVPVYLQDLLIALSTERPERGVSLRSPDRGGAPLRSGPLPHPELRPPARSPALSFPSATDVRGLRRRGQELESSEAPRVGADKIGAIPATLGGEYAFYLAPGLAEGATAVTAKTGKVVKHNPKVGRVRAAGSMVNFKPR